MEGVLEVYPEMYFENKVLFRAHHIVLISHLYDRF